jgi:RNA polymerase sigma factor (sigma-70 family)
VDTNVNRKYWEVIWGKFKAGDRNAFEIIYNEFVDVLYSYGCKITPNKDLLEDSIQDLFIDIYKYGSKLRQPEYLEFYLFKTLKRIIRRKLKEGQKLEFISDSFEKFNLIFSFEEISDKEILEENIRLLQIELQNLDSQKRELLFLKFNSGLTYGEIGALLDIKPDTVKKQVQRLLKHIQNKLGNQVF